MARGSCIIVSAEPGGRFMEGIIDDTSVPGTCMEMVPATTDVGGRSHWRARSLAAGSKGPVYILREDYLQGQLAVGSTPATAASGGVTITGGGAKPGPAYVAGTRCFLYAPLAGEEFNLLLGDVAGTADVVAVGDLFGINNNGKLIANSSYGAIPFESREILAAITGDTMLWVRFRGDQA